VNNFSSLDSIIMMQDNIHQMSNISQLLVHNISLSIKQLQPKDRCIINSLYNELYMKLLGIMNFLTNPDFKEKLAIKKIVENMLECNILIEETECKRILLFRELLRQIYSKNSLNILDWNIKYSLYSQNVFKYFQLIIEDILLSMYSLRISCKLYKNHCGDKCIDECKFNNIYTKNEIVLFITAETFDLINTIKKYINVCKEYIFEKELNLILDFKIITSASDNIKHISLDSDFLIFCNKQKYFKHIIIHNTGYVDYTMDFDQLFESIKNKKILITSLNNKK